MTTDKGTFDDDADTAGTQGQPDETPPSQPADPPALAMIEGEAHGLSASPDRTAHDGRGDRAPSPKLPLPEDGSRRLIWVRPAECRVCDLNGRDQSRLTAESLTDLLASVRRVGFIEPVRVRGTADLVHPYELLVGVRRLAVGRILAAENPDLRIPAILDESLDDEQALLIADGENQGRLDLSAFERGQAFGRALKRCPKLNQAKLARLVGETPALVSHLLRLVEWPSDLIDAYGSAHRVLAVDAERINPLLAKKRGALIAEARRIVAARLKAPLPRAAVTARLVRAASGQNLGARDIRIIGTDGKPILRVTRRSGSDLFLQFINTPAHPRAVLVRAFEALLDAIASNSRADVVLTEADERNSVGFLDNEQPSHPSALSLGAVAQAAAQPTAEPVPVLPVH